MQNNKSDLSFPIDGSRADGNHTVTVRVRPWRRTEYLIDGGLKAFTDRVGDLCQVWGGGQCALVALHDGELSDEYSLKLQSSAIDIVNEPARSVREDEAKFRPWQERARYSEQFVFSLLGHSSHDNWNPLEVPELASDDPWNGIYTACMGYLPEVPDLDLLRGNRLDPNLKFEDFLRVERPKVQGGIEDLVRRMNNSEVIRPNGLSLFRLSSRDQRAYPLIPEPPILPEPVNVPLFRRSLVIVVCSGDVSDLVLLWNLNVASGGYSPLVIGLPVEELNTGSLQRMYEAARSHAAVSHLSEIVLTSWTLSEDDLFSYLPDVGEMVNEIDIFPGRELLNFGPSADQSRNEVVLLEDGRGAVVPSAPGDFQDVYGQPLANLSSLMRVSIEVDGWVLPRGMRVENSSPEVVNGKLSSWFRMERRSEPHEFFMPSRKAILLATAGRRGLLPAESEPGQTAAMLIKRMGGIDEVAFLLHEPLLKLLETMASREGINWYKRKVGEASITDRDVLEAVGRTTDDLPDFSVQKFKSALGNKTKSTEYWLYWAEKKGLIVKGVRISCETCGAEEWVALNGLTLPSMCKGCGSRVEHPFSDRTGISFTYKISEIMRRVYSNDAMGHVIAARYFATVLSGRRLIGWHPGLEYRRIDEQGVIGEADLLLLDRYGQMIPVEIKRSAGGVTPGELEKIERFREELGALWSAIGVCQYASRVETSTAEWTEKSDDGSYKRIFLTYDQLLDPSPHWVMQSDPFQEKILTDEEISDREARFVDLLYSASRKSEISFAERYFIESAQEGLSGLGRMS